MAGKPSIKEGDVFYSNEGYEAVVLKYTNILNVLIEFQDEHKVVKSFTGSHLRKGNSETPTIEFYMVLVMQVFGVLKGQIAMGI